MSNPVKEAADGCVGCGCVIMVIGFVLCVLELILLI